MGNEVKVDGRGFLYVDGYKVCQVDRQGQCLVFRDTHPSRTQQRGGVTEVRVSITALVNVCTKSDGAKGTKDGTGSSGAKD